MVKVLFVCLGNICRSPMAEGSLRKMLDEKNLSEKISCDSAGTSSYHIGELPDSRMRAKAEEHDIELSHRARQLVKDDFKKFDYVMAMDSKNYHNIKLLADSLGTESLSSKVMMMRDFDPVKGSLDVPDPYFGGEEGFQEVYEILKRSNQAFLQYLITEHRLL